MYELQLKHIERIESGSSAYSSNTYDSTKTYGTENSGNSGDGIVRADDVLLGRGGATNNHLGNRRFRSIVIEHQEEYLNAAKMEKISIARKIVSIVRNNGGRFLGRGNTSEAWTEVDSKRAQEKASQALREGLDVRHSQIRTKGENTLSGEGKKSRKPYTIKQDIVRGKVVSGNEAPIPLNAPSSNKLAPSFVDPHTAHLISKKLEKAGVDD
jgi:hypothetical protein